VDIVPSQASTGCLSMAANSTISLAAMMHRCFSPDDRVSTTRLRTIPAVWSCRRLESVNLEGLDKRVHAKTTDTDTLELRLSPDLGWIAFKDHQQYYVIPYRESGKCIDGFGPDGRSTGRAAERPLAEIRSPGLLIPQCCKVSRT